MVAKPLHNVCNIVIHVVDLEDLDALRCDVLVEGGAEDEKYNNRHAKQRPDGNRKMLFHQSCWQRPSAQ